MSAHATLASDTAMVMGIASTAMPFARTPEAQAERWLRLLLQHGESGVALHALGVSDASRASRSAQPEDRLPAAAEAHDREDRDAVARVNECATRIAAKRHAVSVSTADVLVAVIQVYGEAFDRVLRAHGTDRETVLMLLDAQTEAAARG